ncbi:hypothetical protein Q3G72_029892 [Acer saccharum]|nr:hypothetical protein Q3G72_029892 [Acer saccharum]
MFEIEKISYITVPPTASSSDIPNPQPRFMTDLNDVNVNGVDLGADFGDEFGAETDEMGGVPGLRELAVILEVPESVCEMPNEIGNYDLFEDYQFNSENELCSDSDDEGGDSKLATVMKSNPFKKLVGSPIRFEVGQTHDSVYTLRELLIDYTIQEGFNFKKIKNDKTRLTWACFVENYPWRLHVSIVGDETTMQVKTYNNDHTCHRIYKSQKERSKWIASKFEVLVKNNPSIQCGVISDLLRDQFNVNVDTQRLYKGCSPFIGIDGCHLKGPYGGVLLLAVALDANSGLYPLAYCICEGETLLSWSWFLRQLRCFLKYLEDRPIYFMSDRFYARHIYANFSTKYSGQKIRKLFWKATKISDKHEFKKCLQDIGNINPQAMAYLAAIEPCHWSRHAFDNSIKCDHVTNNMTETFNSML